MYRGTTVYMKKYTIIYNILLLYNIILIFFIYIIITWVIQHPV